MAPAFVLDGMDGNTYDLNDYKGKVVVITFWSSRCAICHEEIPKLNRLAAHYKNQNVVFLALTMENEAKVSSYIKNTPIDLTIIPNSFGVVLQYADRDRAGNMDMGFPAYFVVDQTGEIQAKTSGWDKTAGIDSQIAKLLASQVAVRQPLLLCHHRIISGQKVLEARCSLLNVVLFRFSTQRSRRFSLK